MPFNKLRPKQPDPYIVHPYQQELAKFGHLDVIIGYINQLQTQIGATGAKMNMTAGVPPTVNDDSTQGYSVNSGWFDIVNGIVYWLQNPAPGAAVWVPEPSGGSGSTVIVLSEAQAQTRIFNNTLVANGIYNIVDADASIRANIILRARSTNSFYTDVVGTFQNGSMTLGPVVCSMQYVITATTGVIYSVREALHNNYVSCETDFSALQVFRFDDPIWQNNILTGTTMTDTGTGNFLEGAILTNCIVPFGAFDNCRIVNVTATNTTFPIAANTTIYADRGYISNQPIKTVIDITWADLVTESTAGRLRVGVTYHITTAVEGTANIVEGWVEASSPTTLASEGSGRLTNAHVTSRAGVIGFQGFGATIGIKYWKSAAYTINKQNSFNTWFNAWTAILYRSGVNQLDVWGDVPSISLAGNLNGYFGFGVGLDVPAGTSLFIGVRSESASITLTGTQNINVSTFVNCDLDITNGIISNSYTTNGESVVQDPVFGRMSSMVVTSADTGGITNPDGSGIIDLTFIEHVGTIVIDAAGANLITITSFSFLPLLLVASGITLVIDDYTISGGTGNIKLLAPATSLSLLSGQAIKLAYGGGFWQQQAPVLAYN